MIASLSLILKLLMLCRMSAATSKSQLILLHQPQAVLGFAIGDDEASPSITK
jgi:hypothetical protein